MDRLRAYKVRPAPDDPPGPRGRWQQYGKECQERFPGFSGRRLHLKTGMSVLPQYDHVLGAAILDELEAASGVQMNGIRDRHLLHEWVPTVSFTWEGIPA
jgi:hypothetical protein